MAIAEVGGGAQRGACFCDGAGLVFTGSRSFAGNVTSGNLLVIAGTASFAVGTPVASISLADSQGSYTVLLSNNLSFNIESKCFIAYRVANATGANTITVSTSGVQANTDVKLYFDEFSGTKASPLDIDNGGATTGSTSTPSVNITTTQDNDLVVGLGYYDSGTPVSITGGSGYTEIGQDITNTGGLLVESQAQFKIVGSAATYLVDWTWGASKTGQIYSAAFAAVAAGQVPTPGSVRILMNSGPGFQWA